VPGAGPGGRSGGERRAPQLRLGLAVERRARQVALRLRVVAPQEGAGAGQQQELRLVHALRRVSPDQVEDARRLRAEAVREEEPREVEPGRGLPVGGNLDDRALQGLTV